MSNGLRIITSEIPEQENELYISSENAEYSYLAYKNETGSIVGLLSDGNSTTRPIHCTELSHILNSCGTMTGGTVFIYPITRGTDIGTVNPYYAPPVFGNNVEISDTPRLSPDEIYRPEVNSYTRSGVSNITLAIVNSSIRLCDSWTAGEETNFEENYINPVYEDHIGSGETQFGITGRYSTDLENYYSVTSFVDSSDYTDTVDLSGYIKNLALPEITGKVDLGVSYSIGNEIFLSTKTFSAFEYSALGYLSMPNYIINIDGNIRVEYIEGVIKLYPLNDTISEFIINDCILTYGKL